jgi:HD superfamily phosphohydrolase
MSKSVRKIINDPVYGFITIRHPFIFQLINHFAFQRLRRISQLGLSHLVYPGAVHNRFQHAMGAMHLMQNVIDELRVRGVQINHEEEVGLLAAILLHDIGHGPYSHALEHSLAEGVHHEDISAALMDQLNVEMEGALSLAIQVFRNEYPRAFMHELVSSQLDMDRLDYLARDSFFSGVVEGQVGSERILKMMDVMDGRLVVEEKGIYSIEKFIVARRFMYWQVYLHKTVLSAEFMLVQVLKRAKELVQGGHVLWSTPSLHFFLEQSFTPDTFFSHPQALQHFLDLDDQDVLSAIKVWAKDTDPVLGPLCQMLIERKLFKIQILNAPPSAMQIQEACERVMEERNIPVEQAQFFVIHGNVENRAYNQDGRSIMIKMKDGTMRDASQVSDQLDQRPMTSTVKKWFIARSVGK